MSKTVGGRVDITLNGRVYHPVAEVKVQRASFEVEPVYNQDGTVGRSVKSSAYEADLTFRDMDGMNIEELMSSFFDFSMFERDKGRSTLLTGAFLTGKPSENSVNGEISGLKIVSDQYRLV